jgi:hypothetical protein
MSEELEEYYVADHMPTMGQTMRVVQVLSGELICCPYCEQAKLVMQTADLRNGLVLGVSGMFADYYCRNCDKMATLGFFNQRLGSDDDMAARVNWVIARSKL